MTDLVKMFDAVEVAIVASDPGLNIVFVNARSEKMFKDQLNQEDLVGRSLTECHKPTTVEEIRKLSQEFRKKGAGPLRHEHSWWKGHGCPGTVL